MQSARVELNEQGSFRGVRRYSFVRAYERTCTCLGTRGGVVLLWGVLGYTHIHISFDLGCFGVGGALYCTR